MCVSDPQRERPSSLKWSPSELQGWETKPSTSETIYFQNIIHLVLFWFVNEPKECLKCNKPVCEQADSLLLWKSLKQTFITLATIQIKILCISQNDKTQLQTTANTNTMFRPSRQNEVSPRGSTADFLDSSCWTTNLQLFNTNWIK